MTCRKPVLRLLGTLALGLLTPLLGVACGGGGGAVTEAEPGPAFFLQNSTPGAGTSRVALDATIFITFNKAVDPASVVTSSLALRTAGGTIIGGATSILSGSAGRTLRFTTIQSLAGGEVHVCTVAGSLRSGAGEPLEGSASVTFTAIAPGDGGDLPSADQMRATAGQLTLGRQDHTATLLGDGRVLVAGGFSTGAVSTKTAEAYVPASEMFQNLGAIMVESRAGHSATVLSGGQVLLVGGWYRTAGGQSAVRATAEIFDPATNSCTATGSMSQARANHTALRMPDGRVLIAGGSDFVGGGYVDLDEAEIFNPTTGTFSAAAGFMSTYRATHGMVDRGDGTFVLAGGSLGDLRPEQFQFSTGTFTPLNQPAAATVRFGPALAMFASGAVAVVGGETTGTVLHIGTGGFVQNTGSGLSVPRSYATATRIKPDQILVVGGINFSNGGFIESSCDLLIEGGFGGSNTFPTLVRVGTGMAHHSATILFSGDVLFCGGLNENGSLPNKRAAYIFNVP